MAALVLVEDPGEDGWGIEVRDTVALNYEE